jgi:hypothetical protein
MILWYDSSEQPTASYNPGILNISYRKMALTLRDVNSGYPAFPHIPYSPYHTPEHAPSPSTNPYFTWHSPSPPIYGIQSQGLSYQPYVGLNHTMSAL